MVKNGIFCLPEKRMEDGRMNQQNSQSAVTTVVVNSIVVIAALSALAANVYLLAGFGRYWSGVGYTAFVSVVWTMVLCTLGTRCKRRLWSAMLCMAVTAVVLLLGSSISTLEPAVCLSRMVVTVIMAGVVYVSVK